MVLKRRGVSLHQREVGASSTTWPGRRHKGNSACCVQLGQHIIADRQRASVERSPVEPGRDTGQILEDDGGERTRWWHEQHGGALRTEEGTSRERVGERRTRRCSKGAWMGEEVGRHRCRGPVKVLAVDCDCRGIGSRCCERAPDRVAEITWVGCEISSGLGCLCGSVSEQDRAGRIYGGGDRR